MTKELKGFHVLMIAVTAFAIIVAANLTMLFAATGSFPGLVVKNSYVAGVGWNERTAEQQSLGWQQSVSWESGEVVIELKAANGAEVTAQAATVTIGRPATDTQDQIVKLSGKAPFRIPATLEPGQWRIALTVEGDTPYRKTISLHVPEAR